MAKKRGFGTPVSDDEYANTLRFADNVKKLCKAANIPECHVEKSVGVHKGYMAGLRHYRRRVDPIKVNTVATFFGVSIDDILYKALDTSNMEIIVRDKYERPKPKHDVSVNPKICRKCKYRSTGHSIGNCDYILITRKIRPTGTWDKCPVFEKSKTRGRSVEYITDKMFGIETDN